MGHHTETYFVSINEAQTPSAALDRALEMNNDEYGSYHSPRAGHIVTLEDKTAKEHYDDDAEMRDKPHGGWNWDQPTIITPIISEDSITRRTVTKTVTFTGEEWGSNRSVASYERWAKIRAEVAKLVTLREGERVETVEADYPDDGTPSWNRGDAYVTRTSKVVTKATEGKAVTRYFVSVDGYSISHLDMWKKGFDSQALARKAMEDHLKKNDGIDYAEIVAVTRREDGSPLVTTTREVSKVKVAVKVTIAKVKARPTIAGHRVSFDVHS